MQFRIRLMPVDKERQRPSPENAVMRKSCSQSGTQTLIPYVFISQRRKDAENVNCELCRTGLLSKFVLFAVRNHISVEKSIYSLIAVFSATTKSYP